MKSLLLRSLLFAGLLMLSAGLFASSPVAALPVPLSAPRGVELGDPQELETFVDGVINPQMAGLHIAGAVVIIVKDGEALFSKGYGYADVEKQVPVDPETTLFRPGSVHKLVTWTAVMQLVEQGKIDLNADINTYLADFQIPATYPSPITMLDLMSHTAGFAETTADDSTFDPAKLTSLGVYLKNHVPARVYPPGAVSLYSNYGATLAGYIVEQVSGKPYEQYVAEHILKPLGMDHSTLLQPLPEQFAGDLSHSYIFNGEFQDQPFILIQVGPAGGMSASGADMGRFMLAHLQDGEHNGARILQPETARLMHTQSYAYDPAMTGFAHGFAEFKVNGRKLIGHGGHLPEFITELRLLVDEKVGIFVSYNTLIAGGDDRSALIDAFMDHYYSVPATAQPAISPADGTSSADLSRYAGFYVPTRMITTDTPDKLQALSSMMLVRTGPDYTLLYPGIALQALSPFPLESWVEVRPGVFQNTGRDAMMAFKEDEHGQVRFMAIDDVPYWGYVKQPWYGGQDFYYGILIFNLLTFLGTPIVAGVGWIISRTKRSPAGYSPWQSRLARGMGLALSLAFVAFIAILLQRMSEPGHISVSLMAWAIAVLTLCVTILATAAWRQGWWKLAGRLHYTVIALAGLSFTWYMAYWNLLMLP